MCTRQYTGTNGNRAHRAGITAIDTGFTCNDTATNGFLLELADSALDLVTWETFVIGHLVDDFLADLAQQRITVLLVGNLVGSCDGFPAFLLNGIQQGSIFFRGN